MHFKPILCRSRPVINIVLCLIMVCVWLPSVLGKLVEFPATFPRCKAGDVDCILATINRLLATGQNGHPELDLPAIEPFRWTPPIVTSLIGQRTALSVKLRNTDTSYVGLSRMRAVQVIGFEKDPHTSPFEIYTETPSVQVLNNYQATAHIFGIPVVDNGRSNSTLENFKASLKLYPRIETRDGQEYVHFDKIKVNFNVTRFYMHFVSAKSDDPFGPSLNALLNENWRDILEDLRPTFEASIAKLVRSVVRPFFASMPYREYFQVAAEIPNNDSL